MTFGETYLKHVHFIESRWWITAWLSLLIGLAGCNTPPPGKVWVHETRSSDQMKSHLGGCKLNTFLLWPFDWASKCMRRRGYELQHLDGSQSTMIEEPNSTAAQKMKELKHLRDSGAITPEEYDEKRKKYLDQL